MEPRDDSTTIPLPSALLAQLQAAAEEEHRATLEIVREAIERYLEDRQRPVASTASAEEKARAFEVWARSHPYLPTLPDEAIKRENLIRDAQ